MTFSIAITAYFILSIAVVISLRIQIRNAIKLTHAYKLALLGSNKAQLEYLEYHSKSNETYEDAIAKYETAYNKQLQHISAEDAEKLVKEKV